MEVAMNSKVMIIPNDTGQKIKMIIEQQSTDYNLPTIIIVPGFGKTSVDFGILSLYLTSFGFNVVRFDPTNHTGDSEGEIYNFTLSSLHHDLTAVIRFVQASVNTEKIGLLTFSLGSRVGIKVLTESHALVTMVGISTVIDVRNTINRVASFDIYTMFKNDRTLVSHEIMDEIVSRKFIDDSIENDWCDFESAQSDFVSAKEKTILTINGDQDEWIDLDSLFELFEQSAHRSVVILRNSGHNLNLINGKVAMKQAVSFLCREMLNKEVSIEDIITPKFDAVIKKVKEDREMLTNVAKMESII
jgi:pimeloyl-ACP methyl ester carboxylesterase